MNQNKIENIEVQLLLEAIFLRYQYDFRGYAKASIRRRIVRFMKTTKYQSVSEMIPELLHDASFFESLASEFSITVTEMFRDPPMYLSLKKNIAPLLKSYPYLKVWHAGCATGEEAYSLAIVMEEEGFADRVTFFATDFNNTALGKAKDGIYPLKNAQLYTSNYQKAGGKSSFSDYYQARYDALIMRNSLKKKITFANHNLVADQVFTETHLILCRNVLIYFGKDLQKRVLGLFYDSLIPGGFLCLGMKESLLSSGYEDKFVQINPKHKIFKKIA